MMLLCGVMVLMLICGVHVPTTWVRSKEANKIVVRVCTKVH